MAESVTDLWGYWWQLTSGEVLQIDPLPTPFKNGNVSNQD